MKGVKNMEKEELKKNIIKLMGTGIEEIKEGIYFMEMLNIPRRTLTDLLTELRQKYPIISRKVKPCGYYIATNEKEIMEYIYDLEMMVKGCQLNIDNMKNHLEKILEEKNNV